MKKLIILILATILAGECYSQVTTTASAQRPGEVSRPGAAMVEFKFKELMLGDTLCIYRLDVSPKTPRLKRRSIDNTNRMVRRIPIKKKRSYISYSVCEYNDDLAFVGLLPRSTSANYMLLPNYEEYFAKSFDKADCDIVNEAIPLALIFDAKLNEYQLKTLLAVEKFDIPKLQKIVADLKLGDAHIMIYYYKNIRHND